MLLCGWKMDVYRVKDRPNKYTWNFLTSQIIAKASLSICAYPCSVFLSVLEAKAMGCSVPSFTTWEDTAPIPTGDTSQRSLWGRVGSYCVNTCSEVIISFRLWNAVCIVPSISGDGCSLITALKDVKLLTDWARICCSNWLAPETTWLQLHCMGEALSKLFPLSLATCGDHGWELCGPFTPLHSSENIFLLESSQLFLHLWLKCIQHQFGLKKACLATVFKS